MEGTQLAIPVRVQVHTSIRTMVHVQSRVFSESSRACTGLCVCLGSYLSRLRLKSDTLQRHV